MSTNKMSTPTKGTLGGYAKTGIHRDASRFTSHNPFEALEAQSNGSGSSGSPASSGSSTWQNDDVGGGTALISPSQGLNLGNTQLNQQHRGMQGVSPQQMRQMSVNASNMSPTFASSVQNRMPTAAGYSSGSPQKPTTPRRLGIDTQPTGTPQGQPQTPRRDTLVKQASPTSRSGSGRASFSSSLRAPTMLQDPNASSLTGVPEILAVQEMAFRQGQHDHGVARDRLPSSPFAKQFDQVWAEFYVLGKEYGGTPIISSAANLSSSHQNFPWPVLINPYTQDLERPNGAIDAQWVRKVCDIALNCMEALILTVCRREGDWRKTVCDVPAQIKQALMGFADLRNRYESLQRNAREAVAGGLPQGY